MTTSIQPEPKQQDGLCPLPGRGSVANEHEPQAFMSTRNDVNTYHLRLPAAALLQWFIFLPHARERLLATAT
jgi:hypothetical protein